MELVKRESCQEYFKRRISEGWKCISLEGHNAVLLSPEGIRRELDLRNAVETLRPNAAGDETNIPSQTPPSTFHWDKVDEAEADDDTTYVSVWGAQEGRDLYNLPASSGSGTINKITLYFRIYTEPPSLDAWANGAIKSDSIVTQTANFRSGYAWDTKSQEWATNPADDEAWEWADINALQIGINLFSAMSADKARCTQVYVEVDYEAPPAVGLENKSANMAAKMVAAGLI